MVRTADGQLVPTGTRVFNFYDLKWGTIIVGSLDEDGWFRLDQEDGTVALLNGERVSTANLTGMEAR